MLARVAPGSAVAGVFTRSATRSAPVLDCQSKIAELHSKEPVEDGFAILANSGNSNAFTGAVGVSAVEKLTGLVSETLGISERHVFTASTGVIGVPLPSERIAAVVDSLRDGLRPDGIEGAARAIMTTDTFPKGAGTTVDIGGSTISIAGFAKGSGMIAPDMATMLAFIFTDASVEQQTLQSLVSKIADETFNRVTVDSDTSTSDTVIVVATNRSSAPRIEDKNTEEGKRFSKALTGVMENLAKQLVRDGEGATKLAEVRVTGAESDKDAALVAKSIANSPLVKTAIHGEDPNWGADRDGDRKGGSESGPRPHIDKFRRPHCCRAGVCFAELRRRNRSKAHAKRGDPHQYRSRDRKRLCRGLDLRLFGPIRFHQR